jgi:hypothetical protein
MNTLSELLQATTSNDCEELERMLQNPSRPGDIWMSFMFALRHKLHEPALMLLFAIERLSIGVCRQNAVIKLIMALPVGMEILFAKLFTILDENGMREICEMALIEAIEIGRSDYLKFILKFSKTAFESVIQKAVETDQIGIFEILLENGWSAQLGLFMACKTDHLWGFGHFIKSAIDHGADPNAIDDNSLTPLMNAFNTFEGDDLYIVVGTLIMRGANTYGLVVTNYTNDERIIHLFEPSIDYAPVA